MRARGEDHVEGQQDASTKDEVARLLVRLTALHDNIELLVLFGSIARGDATPESDVDLLVAGPVTKDLTAWTHLRGQLIESLGRPVGLLSFDEARQAPEVLVGALRDGRVITDREGRWTALRRTHGRIEAAAQAERETYPARKAAALARLADGDEPHD
jgi:predicted nucleotidyltransferase